MQGLFDIKWSPQGSDKRDQEEDTIFLWEWWLMSIESKQPSHLYKMHYANVATWCLIKINFYFSVYIDNKLDVTLEDMLIFVTGADSPTRFSTQL